MAYRTPTTEQKDQLQALEEAMKAFSDAIDAIGISNCRRKSIAITHLETAGMFFSKAIVWGGDAE